MECMIMAKCMVIESFPIVTIAKIIIPSLSKRNDDRQSVILPVSQSNRLYIGTPAPCKDSVSLSPSSLH